MLQPDAPAPDLSAIPEAAGLWQATHARSNSGSRAS